MKKKIFGVFFATLWLVGLGLFAIPADPTPITIKQPDGRTLTFILKGDENVDWAETLDGYTLLRNADNLWTYAVLNEKEEMLPSTVLATNAEERTVAEKTFVSTLPLRARFSSEQAQRRFEAQGFLPCSHKYKRSGMEEKKFPVNGNIKLPLILVEYQDKRFTYTNADFRNFANQEGFSLNGATGSIRDYYKDNSSGAFTMQIDVFGPYLLHDSMAYYGGNNADRKDQRVKDLVFEALALAKDDIAALYPDINKKGFRNYDNDGDGVVDAFHIIFAGTPESSSGNTDEIWPHRSNIRYLSPPRYDRMSFDIYSISSEKMDHTQMVGIGTTCHEFGHVLGLPDFYDTDYNESGGNSSGLGKWSLMCSGPYLNNGHTPPYLTALEREMVGWHQHDFLHNETEATLYPIQDSNRSYAIPIKPDTSELYISEYRVREGWDRYLPGEGMLIYHIDRVLNRPSEGNIPWYQQWTNNGSGDNKVNADPQNMGCFIEQANAFSSRAGDLNSGGVPFPGSTGNRSFTALTSPATLAKDGTELNTPITHITEYRSTLGGDSLTFKYKSRKMVVETVSPATGITSSQALVKGKIVHRGGSSPSLRQGFVWSTSADSLTLDLGHVVPVNRPSIQFDTTLENLPRGTEIFYCAFIRSANDTSYGNVVQFITQTGLAVAVPFATSDITRNAATLKARTYSLGEGTFIAKGFCYTTDKTIRPTRESASTTIIPITDGDNTGPFQTALTGLEDGVRYYFTAFVETSIGTFYTQPRNFLTLHDPILNNEIVAGSTDSICPGDTPQGLTGGIPTGGKENFTFQWETQERGRDWVAVEDATTKDFQPGALNKTTLIRRKVISNETIEHYSNIIEIVVNVSVGGSLTNTGKNLVSKGDTVGPFSLRYSQGKIVSWERRQNNGAWTTLAETEGKITFSEQTDASGIFSYRVKVKNGNCDPAWSTEDSVIVRHNASVVLLEEEEMTFFLYPNPSTGQLTLTIDSDERFNLYVTDLHGRLIRAQQDVSLRDYSLNLSPVNDGVYLLRVESKTRSNLSFTKKIIIKH